jgi:hypothetical protein
MMISGEGHGEQPAGDVGRGLAIPADAEDRGDNLTIWKISTQRTLALNPL